MRRHSRLALMLAVFAVSTAPAVGYECAGTGATELVDNIDYCADSRLESQSGNHYGPQFLFDNDRATAWCEGVVGTGVGQTITLFITDGAPFDRLLIWNGYQKSEASFLRNGRVKKITVTTDREPARNFTLPDTRKQIAVNLKDMAVRAQVVIEIKSVYPCTHYQDTCLSGVFADLESGRDYQPEVPPPPAVTPPSAPAGDLPPAAPDREDPAAELREIVPLSDLPGL